MVVVNSIKLSLPDCALTVSAEEWTTVSFCMSGQHLVLGAGSRKVLVQRLLAALERNAIKENIGEIDGVTVEWITSLEEKHATFYQGFRGRERVLFVQNEDGATVATLTLNVEDTEDWILCLTPLTA
ncbi:MAG: hypothetical protein AAFP04_16270 [Myxococcota bacterium]